MSSADRDSPTRDSERLLRHQHSSSSDHGRAMIPMWDSSDPERAPPPLPLNPSSPVVNTSRVNTSAAIQTAHAALTEKAREFINAANASSSRRSETSPDRSLVRDAAHKRLQSVQTGHVRGLSSSIEGGNLLSSPKSSPEKNHERHSISHFTPHALLEPRSPDKDKEIIRSTTPTPGGRDTPTLRPSLRKPPQSILGENTPPQSATMMALRSMSTTDMDTPLSNITNGSTALVRTPQTFDAISNQILSLTSIATSLQREMAALSRRSKDNATDLLSLKEATNARDEDIRKSLRELVNRVTGSAAAYNGDGFLLDNKPHTPNSKVTKTFSLPRIPSPTSFSASLDRGSAVSPVPYHVETAATMALLEKILRDMGTKAGQEMLVSRLLEVADRLSKEGMTTSRKMDELLRTLRDTSDARALVPQGSGGNAGPRSRNFSFGDGPNLALDFEPHRSGPMVSRVENLLNNGPNKENRRTSGGMRAAEVINEDILKIIRSVKDSVAQGGGLTAEVKALVRELRGEVLGMGREIGKKLEQNAKDPNGKSKTADKDYVAQVIQDSLEELKQHMDRVIREARRQSASSAVSRSTVDSQEVYNAVRSAMAEMQSTQNRGMDNSPSLAKEDIVDAVREAWENSKPEIEFQHFGLERDELLACLKEGIQEHIPQDGAREPGATREEVFKAVVEAMKHFSPPRIESEANLTREEILDAVRESLADFNFPAQTGRGLQEELTRNDMVEAVREGLRTFEFPSQAGGLSRGLDGEFGRGDLFSAVKAGLESLPIPIHGGDRKVMDLLHEIIDTMRTEFKAVSDEAKQNVAANGRDTEQVLDATKDGFDKLRHDIEAYVDRVAGMPGREEVLESFKREIESLRESMATSVIPGGAGIDREEILAAFRDGLDGLRSELDRPRGSNESILSGTGEILDALHDGLTGLRSDVEKIGSKPVDMTVNYEILDTLKAGLEGVRADIDRLRENTRSDREVAPATNGAVVTAESLKRNDIENLEVLITQLRIKVEAMEAMPPPPPSETLGGSISKEDLSGVEEMLQNVQASVEELSNREKPANEEAVQKEDVAAIETLLRNTKAKLEDMDAEQAARKDHLDMVEELIRETRDSVNGLTDQLADTSRRDDVIAIDVLVKEVLVGLEEIKERAAREAEDLDKVTKTDIEAVETLCFDMKRSVEQLISEDGAALASKTDVKHLGDMVKELKDRAEFHAETNAKSFEDRQAETVGVGERVTEIKIFLEEFKEAIKEKVEDGATGIDDLRKLLESLGDTVEQNSSITDDIKDLFDTVKSEFDKSNAGVVGVKLDSDEKFQKTWGKFDEKFDELMQKYEDARSAADEKAKEGDAKIADAEAAMLSTKAVAEELKILIDALGTTLTESVDRMDEASKTVFNRVEDTFSRVEETHADSKAEHQLTREQVFKAIGAIEDVQGNLQDYHPKILETIKDVLLIVGQHYEHSKTTADVIQEKIAERPVAPPPVEADQPLLREPPVAEKYDDAQVHEKLDKLVDHMHAAGKSFAQLDMLDQIHQRVMQTASEVSNFVSAQTQRIANDHEDKERAVAEATITLEKQLAQKQSLENEVDRLRDQEGDLKHSIASLKAEQDALAHQKMRLSADVSSLETALRIRREELHAMEARAEGLERRILEGVIDHSRAFLISKTTGKNRDAMNLKRVSSRASSVAGGNGSVLGASRSRPSAFATTQSAVGMAMSGSRGVLNPQLLQPGNANGSGGNLGNSTGSSRRILSLSQINHNVPAGGFKRSHSVKDPNGAAGALRKSSWAGAMGLSQRGFDGDVFEYGGSGVDKENFGADASGEEESGNEALRNSRMRSRRSSAGRRSSRGTTIVSGVGTESIAEGVEGEFGSEMESETETETVTETELGTESGYEESEMGTVDGHQGQGGIVLYEDAGMA